MTLAPELILASASPRRARILETLGIRFRTVATNVDESLLPGERGVAVAERLARTKALAAAEGETLPVLAADTIVLCDEDVLGKPVHEEEARRMLRRLSGRVHDVVTGVCVLAAGRMAAGIEKTAVRFSPMSDAEIDWYVASGEARDKAGAYHIDGRGAIFVEAVEGSPSNVAGLPVQLVFRLFRELGIRWAAGP